MAYISKEVVVKHIKDTYEEIPLDVGSRQLIAALKAYIENAPTADVVEVKHGEWIYNVKYYSCSICAGKRFNLRGTIGIMLKMCGMGKRRNRLHNTLSCCL